MAHFFQHNERNNFWFRHFFLKPLFTPLEGVIAPKGAFRWGNELIKIGNPLYGHEVPHLKGSIALINFMIIFIVRIYFYDSVLTG